jgi:hypothetical protein
MKKASVTILTLGLLGIMGAVVNAITGLAATTNPVDEEYVKIMKQDLLCLFMAYPENVIDIEGDVNNKVFVVMKSGKKVLYDDKRKKGPEEKLTNPDIQDMLEQRYPLETTGKLMDKNFDPGRSRSYELLTEVYGGSQGAINKNLKNVRFGYHNYQFNQNNRAAESLKAVSKEIGPLIQSKGNISGYVFPSSGTFNYRKISGTNRLSPHSFGIAIDLVRNRRDYWKWVTPEEGEKRLAVYPKELVEVFERNNFIWGGKWWHFDILHFEYRPEIIMKAKYFGTQKNQQGQWYDGVPTEDAEVKKFIEKVNTVLN